jgi:hypothetical protein
MPPIAAKEDNPPKRRNVPQADSCTAPNGGKKGLLRNKGLLRLPLVALVASF